MDRKVPEHLGAADFTQQWRQDGGRRWERDAPWKQPPLTTTAVKLAEAARRANTGSR